MPVKHFLKLTDLTLAEFKYLFQRATTLKDRLGRSDLYQPLRAKTLAMIFEKNSTRTRVSFEVGMSQLGGAAIFLSPRDTQLERGEPIEDVAKVISRMVDVVMVRTFKQEIVERFATNSEVPVINGLTDEYHPCQILADVFTYIEKRGSIQGKTVAWVGDSNNVCNTWLHAAKIFDFKLNVCTPPGYEIEPERISKDMKHHLDCFARPNDAVRHADLVTTDVWTSMGREAETEERRKRFAEFTVDEKLMSLAASDALFMHCMPAHRGEEVTAAVIDGPHSVVLDEAENRLHTQKALLEYLILGKISKR